jgi:NAD(P)-dependent dehydrogenase (short-subunit alcohol dehydrogenase family)
MPAPQTVLVVGGTGRTGGRVVRQLLGRGFRVRTIVRSADRLPEGVAADPRLSHMEADLLSLGENDLFAQVRDCHAVVSCLGHNISVKGVFAPPRNLVTEAVRRLCRAIDGSRPDSPVKLVLMSSVSVNRPGAVEPRRGALEKLVLRVIRGVLPPAMDNQQAAEFLDREIGTRNPRLEWVCVRPDRLLEGDVSHYTVRETLVSSLFRPDSTNMANVAHFMCELVEDPGTWAKWAGKLPVVVNASQDG